MSMQVMTCSSMYNSLFSINNSFDCDAKRMIWGYSLAADGIAKVYNLEFTQLEK